MQKVHLDVRVLFLKELSSTCYCTPSSYPRNQNINFSFRVPPNFRTSRFIVNLKIKKQKIITTFKSFDHKSTLQTHNSTLGLAGFSNCLSIWLLGVVSTSPEALLRTPLKPFAGSVRYTSAPKARSTILRSILILAGMVTLSL